MNLQLTLRYALLIVVAASSSAGAADWITAPSYYTHSPDTGQRVTQYTPIGPFYVYSDPTYLKSGYSHTRSSIQVGPSADHYHVVQEWGRPVRPYGEWRFPYRPYSVPYWEWGAPFAGFGPVFPPYPYGPSGYGHGRSPYGAAGPDGLGGYDGFRGNPPWYDGNYAPAEGNRGRVRGRWWPNYPGHMPPHHPGQTTPPAGTGGPAMGDPSI